MAEEIKPEKNSGHWQELRLSTRDLPREQQFEFWRNARCSAITPVRLECDHAEDGFAANMSLRRFGPLQLSDTDASLQTFNPVRLIRERSEIARTRKHALMLACNLSGTNSLDYGNASFIPNMEAGSWVLLNTEDRMVGTCHGPRARQITMHIDAEAGASLLGKAGRFFGVPQKRNNMANALVGNYIRTLAHSPMLDPEQAAAIGRHFVDLLALTLNQTPEQFEASQGGVRAALVAAIEREIETHYSDHEFSPARAAANLRITTRYLHKILEPTGLSFSERVMQRRLRHAQTLLSASSSARLGILGIALDSGFRNAEHFSQRFRMAFGMSPREFRNSRIKTNQNIRYCIGKFADISVGCA